jgi:mRNA-degrading endonuclease RelE of RelBE toxin-antitoxin system
MCAKKTGPEIEVYQSRRFEKKFAALTEQEQKDVDEQIELILDDPELGERKKGDLSFLRIYKFRMNNQLYLLGYSWIEGKLELYLLSIGSHENFYDEQKRHRKADLKLIV